MCRLFGFRSVIPSQVHRSLLAAENALGTQSNQHPDGWGVAYYVDGAPHVTKNPITALGDLRNPSYSDPAVKRWNDKIKEADAFLMITPEYNHSTSGALKKPAFDPTLKSRTTITLLPGFSSRSSRCRTST